jgi:hypothetical protein
MIDALEKRMKEVGMVLDDDKSDILFDNIIEIIDEFGTGDYRNHN